MVSVVSVATHAGVSPATVSRVLAGRVPVATETRARVLKAIEQLGYRPNEVARSLRVGRGRSVALVTGDIEQGIYATLAKHVQGELEALGLDLVLFNLGHRQDRLRHFLERAPSLGLRGVLLSSPHVMDMEELAPVMRAAAKSGIDILSVSQDLSGFGFTSIVHDDTGGAALATEHLFARKRTPVAFVGRIATSSVGRARFDAFLRGYFDRFAFHSITTEQFLEYLRRELPTGVPLDEWMEQPGIPAGAAEPHSDALARIDREGPVNTAGWSTHEWLHFLRAQKHPDLARLEREFHFTESGNSEILCQWLQMAVEGEYPAAYPRLEEFLYSVGRRKFIKPLYVEMMKTPEGRERARRIYAKARAGYHPIAQATLDGIVGTSGTPA